MAKSVITTSSIGRKVLMALSGFFLMFFLLQHLAINMLSVVNPDMFNEISHFMGTNPLVQFALQPVLIFAVIFHFVMGMYLETKNNSARAIKYAYSKPGTNSTWMSRNMLWSGLTVLAFLVLHFVDFWIPEINTKYIQGDMSGVLASGEFRYFEELQHKFVSPIRTLAYVISFVFLALHLLHGFQSSFQSVGLKGKKSAPAIKKLGNIFAIVVPLGFVFIAVYHHITNCN